MLMVMLVAWTTANNLAQSITSQVAGNEVYLRITNLPTPKAHPDHKFNKKEQPKWTYWWEFGDGEYYYSNEKSDVRHSYRKSGEYKVKCFLLPQYSTDKDIASEVTVSITSSGRLIHGERHKERFESNSNGFAAPGYRLRYTVSTKLPTGANSGYLVIFFNSKKEYGWLNTESFDLIPRDIQIFGADAKPVTWGTIGENNLDRSRMDFMNYKAFKLENFDESGEARMFFTLTVSEAISDPDITGETNIPHGESFIPLKIETAFVPDNNSYDENTHKLSFPSKLKLAIDPNRIIPIPDEQNYKRNKLCASFRVDFENLGEGTAESVRIKIPWDEKKADTSILIYEAEPRNCLEECAEGFNSKKDKSTICYTKWMSENGDTLNIQLNNIKLPGRKDPAIKSKDDAKGHIEFRVEPEKSRDLKLNRAVIVFIGPGGEEVKTPKSATVRWMQMQLVADVGILNNIGLNRGWTGGVGVQKVMLNRGWGWYAGVRTGTVSTDTVFVFDAGTPDAVGSKYFSTESKQQMRMKTFELEVAAKYALNHWINLVGGAGYVLPFAGGKYVEQTYTYYQFDTLLVAPNLVNPQISIGTHEIKPGKIQGEPGSEFFEKFNSLKGMLGGEIKLGDRLFVTVLYEFSRLPNVVMYCDGESAIPCKFDGGGEPGSGFVQTRILDPYHRWRLGINIPLNISPENRKPASNRKKKTGV